MKKSLVFLHLILSVAIYSSQIVGQIYNLDRRGSTYKGTFDGRLFNNKNKARVRVLGSKDVEISKVNGEFEQSGIYEIKNENIRVDFIYKGNNSSMNKQIFLGTLEYLDEFSKKENLIGEIAVEFRKIGKIDMKVRGELNFGIIPARVPTKGVSSKKEAEVTLDLSIDKKDVGNTKMYFEYPSEVNFLGDKVSVKLEVKDKSGIITETIDPIKKNKVITFFPKKEKTKEKITLGGRLFSKVKEIPPGNYNEKITVKAFYEYLDYSVEKNEGDRKVIIRR